MDKDVDIIERMRTHIMDAAIVKEGCQYINEEGTIANERNEITQKRRKDLMDKGAGAMIIEGMKTHKNNHEVLQYGCMALKSLARNDNNKIALMKLGAGEAIVNALNERGVDADVQRAGCGALLNLAICDDNRAELIRIGAGNSIVNALNVHKNNANIQHSGCGALMNLSANDNNKVILMKINAGEAIVNAMNVHKDNANVQQNGCGALLNLALNEDNVMVLMNIGAGEAIIDAMNNHKDIFDVQYQGCVALLNLSAINHSRSSLLNMGAAEVITYALNKFKDNADIQHQGCGALFNLSTNTIIISKLMQVGASDVVIHAMNLNREDENIQHYGCGVLCNLAISIKDRVKLIQSGAGEAIISAMSNFTRNIQIQQSGCVALSYLAWSNENKQKLMAVGAAEVILNALKNHTDDASIQLDGSEGLKKLISSNACILQAIMHGLDFKIVDLIRDSKSDKRTGFMSFFSKVNTPLGNLKQVKSKIAKFEASHSFEVYEARKEYLGKNIDVSSISQYQNIKEQTSEKETQNKKDLENEITNLKKKIDMLESGKFTQKQKYQHESVDVRKNKVEQRESLSIKLESFLASPTGNEENFYMINELKDILDNQITSSINHLNKSKDVIMNSAEVFENFLKIERFERIIKSVEGAKEILSFEKMKQKLMNLIDQSKSIDPFEEGFNKDLQKELLKQKGEDRDKARANIVDEFNNIKMSMDAWKAKIQESIFSNEWQEFPNIVAKIKEMDQDSIQNVIGSESIRNLNEKIQNQVMVQSNSHYKDEDLDIYVGNELMQELISSLGMLKKSADSIRNSSRTFNEFICKYLITARLSGEKLMNRKLIIEQDIQYMLNEWNQQSSPLEYQVARHEKRKNIKESEERIEKIDDEISRLELSIKELDVEMIKRRKTITQTEKEKLEAQLANSKQKLRLMMVDHEDMIEELFEKFNDENGNCIFPELTILHSFKSPGQPIDGSLQKSTDLIRIPRALKMKSTRCEILDRIGDGGFSCVFKIKIRSKERPKEDYIFAFKQFAIAPNTVDQKELELIEREIEMLEHLEHENIIKIVGALGDPDAKDINGERMGIGIVMEHSENGSLRSLLNKNRYQDNFQQKQHLNLDSVIHLLFGAAQGLEYLHNHIPYAIIHGDIKSDNILVDKEFNAKICDFGISKLMQSSMVSSTRGQIGGSLAYRAPETFDGKIELKSDVYSFGCVILEMLTGERPWSNLNDSVVAKVLVQKEEHDLSKIRPDAGEELIDLMKRCLDYDKDKRPTMREVRIELERLMKNVTIVRLEPNTDEYTRVQSIFFPGGDKEGSLNRNNYRIVKIERVMCRFAEILYEAEKEKTKSIMLQSVPGTSTLSDASVDVNERLLFHGTGLTDPMKILNHPDAFMKDYATQGFYGKGLYFAELARYSNGHRFDEDMNKVYYRYNIPNTKQHQMLVCSVICGKSLEFGSTVSETTRSITLLSLEGQLHSIHAGPHQPYCKGEGDDDSCMYVVYKDTQVVARYLITYESLSCIA